MQKDGPLPRYFPFRSALLALATAFAPIAATAQDLGEDAGAYLAARHADVMGDFDEAARYFTKALAADRTNGPLMEALVASQISLGNVAQALPIARLLSAEKSDNQIANMVILSQAAQANDFDQIVAMVDENRGIGPLVDGLIQAWAYAGQGEMADALARFDDVSEQPGLMAFGLYHKALALMTVGDFESAVAIFEGEEGNALPPTRRGVVAFAEALSQVERQDDAVAMIDEIFNGQLDPGLSDMRAALAAGEVLPRTAVRNVADGMAEVFFSIAAALDRESEDAYTLLYARIAEDLRPDHIDAHMLVATIFERMGQYELATAAFGAIPQDNPAYYAAEAGRADALRKAGRTDAALEVLQQLARSHPDIPEVHITLGDMLRSDEKYEAAAKAYTAALEGYSGEDAGRWTLYFTRGITQERLKNWDNAEADFRKALELEPDQPQVLNYLGYSYLEMGENLEEALEMIEKAVAQRPDDGPITDSLGWGFYLAGRYDEAVVQMERAVELMPVDAVVNDHLGDVYWAVGRQREARFQWQRALSFEPEPDEADRMRRKLEIGLDAVLAEEGADPLKMADGG